MHFEQSVVSLLKSTVLAEFKKWRHMPCIREFNLPSFQSAHKVLPFLNVVQMCHQSCESFSYSYPRQVSWQQTLLMDVLLWWSPYFLSKDGDSHIILDIPFYRVRWQTKRPIKSRDHSIGLLLYDVFFNHSPTWCPQFVAFLFVRYLRSWDPLYIILPLLLPHSCLWICLEFPVDRVSRRPSFSPSLVNVALVSSQWEAGGSVYLLSTQGWRLWEV